MPQTLRMSYVKDPDSWKVVETSGVIRQQDLGLFLMTPVPVAPVLSTFVLLLWLTAFHCLSEAFAN